MNVAKFANQPLNRPGDDIRRVTPDAVREAERRQSCISPPLNQCHFYRNCLEKERPCGRTGYALKFAEHFCNKFKDLRPRMSPRGQQWITDTMACLQMKLVPVAVGRHQLDCTTLKLEAQASHVDCYVQNGFCDIVTEWHKISELFGVSSLLEAETVKASSQIMQQCFGRWANQQLIGLDSGWNRWFGRPTGLLNRHSIGTLQFKKFSF